MSASPACARLQRSGSQCFNLPRSKSVGKLKANATPRDRLQRACSYNNFDREEEFFDRRSSSNLTPNDIARSISSAAAAAEESLAPARLPSEPAAPINIPHHAAWPASPHNLPAADNNSNIQPDMDRPYKFYPGAATHRNLNSQINNTTTSSNALSSLDTESWEEEILAPERIPGRVFVILFGVGEHQTEGIYSLRAAKDEDSLPQDTVVAFIDEDDALRYSTQLEASMDHSPTVFPIDWSELVNFCYGAGYKCRTEARGTLLMPPDHNVGLTDWEKALHLRQGRFQVLDSDPILPSRATVTPEAAAAAASTINEDTFFIDGPEWVFEGRLQASVVEEVAEEDADKDDVLFLGMDTKLADPAQLEALKQSLERLLPIDEF